MCDMKRKGSVTSETRSAKTAKSHRKHAVKMRAALIVCINGVPYAQVKSRGRKGGCQEWTDAVVRQTSRLRQITGPCRVEVVFRLPEDKYPADHPFGMDLDNLLKRFFDALQFTVFRDVPGRDGCVVELIARKVRVNSYGESGADLEITPLMDCDMKRKGAVASKTGSVDSGQSCREDAVRSRTAARFKESDSDLAIDHLCGIAKGLGLPPNVERDPDREIE